jgi:hypothetical protein
MLTVINWNSSYKNIMTWKSLCLAGCIGPISQNIANAQVVNDNIGNRSRLILDSASIYSSTDEASVEWQCINKALTNKCLIYHNDQWFTFNVKSEGTYYLNITSQNCRDSRGIQAIVIEAVWQHIRYCIVFRR